MYAFPSGTWEREKLEIKNRSKTVFLSKEEIKNIELEHTFILRVGHFYQCKLSNSFPSSRWERI